MGDVPHTTIGNRLGLLAGPRPPRRWDNPNLDEEEALCLS
jgi:hypothetical protein